MDSRNEEDGKSEQHQVMQTFDTGAKRSSRMPRYDLIPKVAIDRLAERFTGHYGYQDIPEGGALKYGEGNWEKGLPTSDVINHAINHLTRYQDAFRQALTRGIHNGYTGQELMSQVMIAMHIHTRNDDDLAAVMWGCSVLMTQEITGMFHDDKFKLVEPVPADSNRFEGELCDTLMHMPDDQALRIEKFLTEMREIREKRRAEANGQQRRRSDKPKNKSRRNVKHSRRDIRGSR